MQAATSVKNTGTLSSGTYTVQFRLVDDSNPAQYTSLASVSRSSISAGKQSNWSQSLTIPANLEGNYHLRIVVDPANKIKEKSESNNTKTDSTGTAVLNNSILGSVVYGGSSKPVSIHPLNPTAPLLTDVPTWIVIHGRNSTPEWSTIQQIGTAISNELAGDQVLVLDWGAAADNGYFGGGGENYIKPIAQWAAGALAAKGITGDELNLVGHSWGAYIASEMAEVLDSGVSPVKLNSLIALDAAADFPGGSYNPLAAGEVNFAAHTEFSWAFYDSDGDSWGSGVTAVTADETIAVKNSAHSPLVQAVADLIALPSSNELSAQFDLARLLAGEPSLIWTPNRYTASGAFSLSGLYDAVLYTTSSGTKVSSLKWYDGSSDQTLPV